MSDLEASIRIDLTEMTLMASSEIGAHRLTADRTTLDIGIALPHLNIEAEIQIRFPRKIKKRNFSRGGNHQGLRVVMLLVTGWQRQKPKRSSSRKKPKPQITAAPMLSTLQTRPRISLPMDLLYHLLIPQQLQPSVSCTGSVLHQSLLTVVCGARTRHTRMRVRPKPTS